MNKYIKITVSLIILAVITVGCVSDADMASQNLSTAADQFQIERRIIFYNGITGEYILSVQGKCSIGNNDGPTKVSITCKTGNKQYKKHYLGLSDNVTYFAEQIDSASVSAYHYKVIFKPESIIPDIDLETSVTE